MDTAALWLTPIPSQLREKAADALERGDVSGFLFLASNEHGLLLVWKNMRTLMERGIYEAALLDAFTDTRTNNHRYPAHCLRSMFAVADRARLRALGDPLPGAGPFTIYRGVAGCGSARRVRGLSWSASKECARWFARRLGLPNPDVFKAVLDETDVLAYTNRRHEEEFLVLLPDGTKPLRLPRIEGPTGKMPAVEC